MYLCSMKCRLCNLEIKQLQNRNRTRCSSCNTKIRRYRNKLRAVQLLGGKCIKCGYDNFLVLEFHHRNPKEKEFNIGMVANRSWGTIVDEISKCDLLCANCHRLEHTSRSDEVFVKEAMAYRGK